MDAARFDQWTKALVASSSRRRLLAGLAAGAGGALASACLGRTRAWARTGADAGCESVFTDGVWEVVLCRTDPIVPATMEIVVGGVSRGKAALVAVHHQAQGNPSRHPQVAVVYQSGFVRIKQNAEPPVVPFGGSFILGPSYWQGERYRHSPELARLEVGTAGLPAGPMRLRAKGKNGAFRVAYAMELTPADALTRLCIDQTYEATRDIAIDRNHRALSEGFKLVHVSTMFINDCASCNGGAFDCHDIDAAGYVDADSAEQLVEFAGVGFDGFVFDAPRPLGQPALDALHTDDCGWQGATPNLRIELGALPTGRTITPQGWITATANPNDDNVDVWLHDDGKASRRWTKGQKGRLRYCLLAQDDPPPPWADLQSDAACCTAP